MINEKTGKQTLVYKWSNFYLCYFVWTDLTREEVRSVEGVDYCVNNKDYFQVKINYQYDAAIVFRNINKLAESKLPKQKSLIDKIKEMLI